MGDIGIGVAAWGGVFLAGGIASRSNKYALAGVILMIVGCVLWAHG